MTRVAVVGAGLIGRAWALLFARAGREVRVFDSDAEVRAALDERLAEDERILVRHGLHVLPDAPSGIASRTAAPTASGTAPASTSGTTSANASDTLSATVSETTPACASVTAVATLEEAVDGAAFVQENGPEDVEVKRVIFAELDALAPPEAILASSTSAIVASRFTEGLAGRGRCLVGHPVNPPHLVPVVEVCGSEWTSEESVARACDVYRGIGQVPVRLRHERDGFVLNRLQGALLGEAFRLVLEGVVSPEDLDHVIKDGLGLRWAFMGPFETIDLNAPAGLADYLVRYGGFYAALAADPPPAETFGHAAAARLVDAWPHPPEPGRIAALTAWRDERLAALVAHKRVQATEHPAPDTDDTP